MEVSVIVPVYNAQAWLARCLDSILCQTFTDFELILVDDGSHDSSRDIMTQYARSDKRIVCVSTEKNGGASSARNLGLDKATGKYLMFADSDDCVADDWIERLLYEQKKYGNLFVMSNICDRLENSDCVRLVDYCEQKKGVEVNFYTLFSMLHLDGYLFNKIFDNQVIKKHNLRFNPSLREGEDVDFIYRYISCKKYSRFWLIVKSLYFYNRGNGNSITKSFNPNALSDNLHCFECRLPYIANEHLTDYCEHYFSYLWGMLGNAHDKRANKTWLSAMKYNYRVIKSDAFRQCFSNSRQAQSGMILTKIIKTYNYYIIWTFQRLTSLIARN